MSLFNDIKNDALRGMFNLENDQARRARAAQRVSIWRGDFAPLVARYIDKVHEDPDTRQRVKKFISLTCNPAQDVTRDVAIVYDDGVLRQLDGAGEATQLAFNDLAKESQILTKATQWNRVAYYPGPMLAFPRVVRGKLRFVSVWPHVCSIAVDPTDPDGVPSAAIWSLDTADDQNELAPAFRMANEEAWFTFNSKGDMIGDPEEHGLGRFPGSVFRLTDPEPGNWWNDGAEVRLTDGTIEVAYACTKLEFTRKGQDKKVLVIKVPGEKVAKGQIIDAERPFHFDAVPAEAEMSLLDYVTSPDDFLVHIKFLVEMLLESRGVPQGAVNYDFKNSTPVAGGPSGTMITIRKERLGHLRENQVLFAERFEDDLWPLAMQVMRRDGHPSAGELPPPDEFADQFKLVVPNLKVIDNPVDREQDYQEKAKRGAVSPFTQYQEDHPELTLEQAKAEVMQNIADRAEIHEEQAKRGLIAVADDGRIASSQQVLGRLGGETRARNEEARSEEGTDE